MPHHPRRPQLKMHTARGRSKAHPLGQDQGIQHQGAQTLPGASTTPLPDLRPLRTRTVSSSRPPPQGQRRTHNPRAEPQRPTLRTRTLHTLRQDTDSHPTTRRLAQALEAHLSPSNTRSIATHPGTLKGWGRGLKRALTGTRRGGETNRRHNSDVSECPRSNAYPSRP